MKKLQDVKNEIASLKAKYQGFNDKDDDPDEKKKDVSKLALLYEVQLYLETNPSQEFVENEVKTLHGKLDRINEAFDNWLQTRNSKPKSDDDRKEFFAKYKKEMGVAEINKSIKHLKFILQ